VNSVPALSPEQRLALKAIHDAWKVQGDWPKSTHLVVEYKKRGQDFRTLVK